MGVDRDTQIFYMLDRFDDQGTEVESDHSRHTHPGDQHYLGLFTYLVLRHVPEELRSSSCCPRFKSMKHVSLIRG